MTEAINRRRRRFLQASGSGVAAVTALTPFASARAQTESGDASRTTLNYPDTEVIALKKLLTGESVHFKYPDSESPCIAIKLGNPVPGGVGPENDIVAYSLLCTHMGCPTNYDANSKTLKCPCHFSEFDVEKSGQMICGQATQDLPRILLQYDEATDTVRAVGVDGLIYGRQANII